MIAPLALFTSCSAVRRAMDEDSVKDLVEDMLEDYFASPDDYNWRKVCESGYTPESLNADQAELLRYVAGKIRYSARDVVFDDTGDKAKVTYRFSKVPDLTKLELEEESVTRFKNEIKSLDVIEFDVTFQIVYQDRDWVFHSLSKFGKYFIHPFCDLKIGSSMSPDPTPVPTEAPSQDADDIRSKYLATVWYGIETGNPMNDLVVSDAYAVQNVFYFTEPVSGEFVAKLINSSGKDVLTETINVDSRVTVVCDFSAGHQGWGTFDPDTYYVELYFSGQKIATSETITVN